MAMEVLGLYNTRADADAAAQALQQAGFSRSDINVESYNGQTYNAQTAATTGQKAESGWDRMLEKLHLMAPQHETSYYSQGLSSGQTLVTVTTDDDNADQAADILDQYGAQDIDNNAAQYQTAQTGQYATGANTQNINTQNVNNAQGGAVIPVVEEELAVGKRQVRGGGVRVYQHVTERPVEEQVTLHEETVTVDRRPVNRAATDADFQNQDFTVTETSEEAVVGKQARVVEEVVVGKTAQDRTETVRDTVRRTDVEVDEMDADDDVNTTNTTLPNREVVR